ncbi:MAG: DegT/DnrJ/EryC1/StrS family aminotransferase [Desulfobaccales bacterium]
MKANLIPYARPWVDEQDIASVVEVLHSQWLTTGPKVEEFERAVADFVGARGAVATANAVVYQGSIPVFADIDPGTLLIDPEEVERKITPRTKAVIAVDYAGQPCDYDRLTAIARRHGLWLVADACHSLGASYRGRAAGTLADLTVLSFHPVKHLTTGETDVLDRFYQAARYFQGDSIIRITGDCPLVDPEIVGRLLDLYAGGDYDHVGVATGAGAIFLEGGRLPVGLDAECFGFAALQQTWLEAGLTNFLFSLHAVDEDLFRRITGPPGKSSTRS